MKELLLIFAAAVVILLLCFAGMGIKILLKRNGEFKRQCASCDPYTGERKGCLCGKKTMDEHCPKDKQHSILEVNKNLMDELK
ncbi:MAG: hypothetical protein LBO06_01740 [Bacteroidales bacterium]|jgi:hypothetical protein|nr:hypothetical protein [Bacteroidales bacterium]